MTEDIKPPSKRIDEELESLMHRYQQADATAATLLAERLSVHLFRFFVMQVRDRDKAQDLLQDCWLRIHKARHTYRPTEPLLPWVYAIARRVKVDQYRSSQRIARHEFQTEHLTDIAVETPPQSEKSFLPEMAELLEALPQQQRETVLLLKVSGLSLEEVSRATGVSIGAVKQRAHRAYSTLRRLLGGDK